MQTNIDYLKGYSDILEVLFLEIKKEYPQFISVNNDLNKRIHKNLCELNSVIKETEDEIDGLCEEISDLKESNCELEFKYKTYENFEIKGPYDEMKVEIIRKAFNEYSLEELENKLGFSWI